MKIGIEASTQTSKTTGTNRYLSCLLEQLESTGNEIINFSPNVSKKGRLLFNFSGKGINKHIYRNLFLKNEIESSEIECAIFPDYFMPPGIKKPAAVIIHDLSFITYPEFYSKKFTSYINYQIKNTLRENPVIITVSEHTRNNIVKYLNVRKNDVKVMQGYTIIRPIIPGSILKKKDSRPYFLSVGHLEPRKNLKFMIEGFLKWNKHNRRNFRLIIVGEVWINSKEIKEIIKNYHSHPDIEFTGYIPEDELSDAYNNASGFIHTSFEEGFGFPVLEAMHYNLPIICSKGIATDEISGTLSIKINPESPLSYYNGLEKLAQMANSNSRPEYFIKYCPELMKTQLEEVLDELSLRLNKKVKSSIPRAKSVIDGIEKTLIYSSLFNSGIRKENLMKYIFDVKTGTEELESALSDLKRKDIIQVENDFICLKHREEGFYKRSKKRINRTKLLKLMKFLNNLPLISSIAFSGGTTHYGLENHDDIDLFIITRPDTVYIVYILIHMYSLLFKCRKELCANYLIDEANLEISHSYDIYTAHQIISLTPSKNPEMLDLFFSRNIWVKKIFPNFEVSPTKGHAVNKFYVIFKPINYLLMILYRNLYRNKLKINERSNSLMLRPKSIKLHTNDHKEFILNEFERKFSSYYKMKYSAKKYQLIEIAK